MNKEHPPVWSDDPLSAFFNDCEYNARACALNYPDAYALLKSTHAAFITAQAALEKDNRPDLLVPRFLFVRAHSSFLAAIP